MGNQPTSEPDPLHEAREKTVEAALPHVVFDGWSNQTLDAAIAESGADPALAHLAFPRGGIDLALEFHRMNDRRLDEELRRDPSLAQMKVREKIAHAVRRRLEIVAPHREAVRRGATLLALPVYAGEGAKAIWETADRIWTAIGDTSTDYNWYTKRAILSSVYSATVLYWLGDDTPGHSATWAFLDRRIDEVMRFEKTKSMLTENPVARAAMWGPTQLMKAFGGIRREPTVPTPAPGGPAPETPVMARGPAPRRPGTLAPDAEG